MRVEPIGIIETAFREKFGVPRQSGMVPAARGVLRLLPEYPPESVLHLSGFSHLWILYAFHKGQNSNHPAKWTPTIEPPRIEAPKRVGVFASRSPHRPNPIGMSVVRIEEIRANAPGGIEIEVSGVDLLDGTPVLDLKPYVPYADCVSEAASGWVGGEISRYPVSFSEEGEKILREAGVLELARQVLQWDPRPRSQREQHPLTALESEGRVYRFRLGDFDLHWRVESGGQIHLFRAIRED